MRTAYRVAFTFRPAAQQLYGLSGIILSVTAEVLDASLTGPPPEPSPPADGKTLGRCPGRTLLSGTVLEALTEALGRIRSLERALDEGREQLLTQFLLENPELAGQPLQDAGAWYPLHAAASAGNHFADSLLLLHGADAGARTYNQETALHLAARNGHVETLRMLLDAGAEIDAVDGEQHTPLQAAINNGDNASTRCAHLLLERGAYPDLNSLARLGQYEQIQAILASDPQAIASAPVPTGVGGDLVEASTVAWTSTARKRTATSSQRHKSSCRP